MRAAASVANARHAVNHGMTGAQNEPPVLCPILTQHFSRRSPRERRTSVFRPWIERA